MGQRAGTDHDCDDGDEGQDHDGQQGHKGDPVGHLHTAQQAAQTQGQGAHLTSCISSTHVRQAHTRGWTHELCDCHGAGVIISGANLTLPLPSPVWYVDTTRAVVTLMEWGQSMTKKYWQEGRRGTTHQDGKAPSELSQDDKAHAVWNGEVHQLRMHGR